jgi:hypothetical protein
VNEDTLKTLSLCSFFVFIFGTSGFLVTIILNTSKAYIELPSNQMYENWVATQLFSIKYIPYYLLMGIMFAGLGLFLIYRLKQSTST